LTDPIFIIDEFHNLSKNNVTDETNDFYKLLFSDHRILFVSATPRIYELEDQDYELDVFGEIVDPMSFSDAIENKFITDYKIWLPSIHEDNDKLNKELSIFKIDSVVQAKCNFLFSCLVNNGSKKCIIYCQDSKEIGLLRDAISTLNDNFYFLDIEVNQITCSNSAESRTKILDNFANSVKIQLLFSVRILDECIDIPKCDSIYITYPSKSKIRTIQRLCRCIRINKNDQFKIGNIMIWCDQYDEILETLSGIKEYDPFFKDKIHLNSTNYFGDSSKEKIEEDLKVINEYILGVREFKQLSWTDKLNELKQYIDNNKKRPLCHDKNNEYKCLSYWLGHQNDNYKNKKQIMKNEAIFNKYTVFLTEYAEYFLTNKEIWNKWLDNVILYMDINKKRPSSNDKNEEYKRLGYWLEHQNKNYKNKKYIMKNEAIFNKFTIFLIEYTEYFLTNEEIWEKTFDNVIQYIENNKKTPSKTDKNEEYKRLARWLGSQNYHYKNKKDIMKNEAIFNKFTIFLTEYAEHFLTNEEIWTKTFDNVIQYMDNNKKRPSCHDKNTDYRRLGQWLVHQIKNYKNKKGIMKNEAIFNKFTIFFIKYAEYI
jgi:hypothetical protein